MSELKRPNILFFFTDDQRFDTIHALGNDEISTPTMDRLVAEGVTFTHGSIMGGSSAAVCRPSRAMLMTGRTLYRLEAGGGTIPEDHVMLPEVLREAGYETFGTGKWHNSPAAYGRAFSDGGEIFFGGMGDHWNVPACRFDPTGRYPDPRELSRTVEMRFDDSNTPVRRTVRNRMVYDHTSDGKHSSDLFADAAMDFLDRRDPAKPFFAYVSFMAPHDPRETHAEYHDMYPPETVRLPESFAPKHAFDNGEMVVRDELLAPRPRTPEDTRRQIGEYYAMITHADAQMGRVLDKLRETGEYENTILVFAGDNGLAVGRHGLMGKQNLYDHSIRVPLVMAGPGIPKDEKRDAFAYLLDIYPTLCELLDLDVPDSVDGKSLVPAMRDPEEKIRDTLHYAYRHLHRGVRDRRYKLIEYVVEGERTTQLFDLENDPHEMANLAADPDHAGTVARLRTELLRWRDEYDDNQEQGQAFWGGYGEEVRGLNRST